MLTPWTMMTKTKMIMMIVIYDDDCNSCISTTSMLDLKKMFLIIDEREERKKKENDPSSFCLDHLFVMLMKKPKENDCSDISLSFTSCIGWRWHTERKGEDSVFLLKLTHELFLLLSLTFTPSLTLLTPS